MVTVTCSYVPVPEYEKIIRNELLISSYFGIYTTV